MYNPLLLIIAIFFQLLCNAQDKIIIHQPYLGRVVYPVQTIEVNSLNQLPSKHQFIINTVIGKSMTEFQDSIVFVKGQIIDVEKWFTMDSIPQTRYQYVIPMYQLFFELRDISLGVIKYVFELSLDQYGQVIKLDWPRSNYNKRSSFVKTDSVLQFAVDYAKSKGYNTDIRRFHLQYNKQYNNLCWLVSFLQSTASDKEDGVIKFKTIAVDARRLAVIAETEMFESSSHVIYD